MSNDNEEKKVDENNEDKNNSELSTEELQRLKEENEQLKKEIAERGNKEFNYRALRKKQLANIQLTDEEKQQLIGADLEELRKEQEQARQSTIQERMDDALELFAGDDNDLREKIKFHYARISDTAVTRQEISKKMKDAYNLAVAGNSVQIDPIARANAYQYGGFKSQKESGLTVDQKALASRLGLTEEDLKNVK